MKAVATEIRAVEGMAFIRADWDALLSRCSGYGLAQTPIYAEVAAATLLRRGHAVHLIAAYADGQLRGVWPVSIRPGLLRELRPLSCGSYEEYGAPLIETDYAVDASSSILRIAVGLRCDTMRVQAVATATPFAEALAALNTRGRQEGSIEGFRATLSRFSTWDQYCAQASKSHMATLRRKMRQLQERGEVELGWCSTPEDAALVIRWIWAQKRAWAKKRRLDTPWLWSDDVMLFFVKLAARVDLSSLPLVTFLKVDGAPVAAQVNLVGGRSFEFFITTFDVAFARYSPGELLIQDGFRFSIAHGLDFDFRILAADYKVRLSDTVTTYSTTELYLTPRGAAGAPLLRNGRRLARKVARAPGKLLSLLRSPRRQASTTKPT